jgi:hypothetical protein
MDLNLDSLKDEILRFLEASEFAVFRGHPGALDDLPVITWDSESFPDYRMFLDTAQRSGEKSVIFVAATFEEEDVADVEADVALSGLDREHVRSIEQRLHRFRAYIGKTCFIQLAFDHRGRLYVYEMQPDWYGEYLELTDELDVMLPHDHDHDEENEDDEPLGGFYSNN